MAEEIRKVSYCPHCGNRAPQRLVHTQRFVERVWNADGSEAEPVPWSSFVASCDTCGRILVYDNIGDMLEEKQFVQGELEYPQEDRLHSSVPSRVAEVYAEAARVKQVAPNAFAVQLRKALEVVCADRGASGRTLAKRLENLTDRGEIPPTLSKSTDMLRILGNIGAHDENISVHPLHVRAIDDFFRAIIEYIYVAPNKINEFQRRLDKMKCI